MEMEQMANYAERINSSIAKYSALQSLILGEEIKETQTESLRQFRCIKEYLDMPIGDRRESGLKKIFATAVITARDKGVLPFELPEGGADAIAATIDEGLTRTKVAYRVATGKIDVVEGANILIDKGASRVTSAVNKVFKSGVVSEVVSRGVVRLCKWVGFPQVEKYRPVIKAVIHRVEEPVRKVVTKGIKFVATAAKTVVRAAATVLSKAINKGREIWSRLFS